MNAEFIPAGIGAPASALSTEGGLSLWGKARSHRWISPSSHTASTQQDSSKQSTLVGSAESRFSYIGAASLAVSSFAGWHLGSMIQSCISNSSSIASYLGPSMVREWQAMLDGWERR